LLVPTSIAVNIVAPERDVPGKDAGHDLRDADKYRDAPSNVFAIDCRAAIASAPSIQNPPINNAQAIGVTVSGNLKP
jgi:hypothetical protein